jgi:glycosyltransferase involved in cell wall biosynthesis
MPVRPDAEVCLVLEGTYPYVPGGVSSWVHDILHSLPDQPFSLLHIGPRRDAYGPPRYEVPPNVTQLVEHYLHAEARALTPGEREQLRAELEKRIRSARKSRASSSRTLAAIRRLHLEERVDDALLDDLAAADCSVDQLLHGDEAFAVISDIYRARAPSTPFLDYFWSFRSMHVPVVTLLEAEVPRAAAYHSVSTGYAGMVAAIASRRTGRPMLLTEHGIYAREREMELARATWIPERAADPRLPAQSVSPLRQLWSRFFLRLSQIAYHQATSIVTLSEVNRQKQLADGAAGERTSIIPNGVDVDHLAKVMGEHVAREPGEPLRVGFVGRVVPIKDVMTFVRAMRTVANRLPEAEGWIIGPEDEDPEYAQECHNLAASLGLEQKVRFLGFQSMTDVLPQIGCVALSSISEALPLVLLEGFAAGVPAVATDVGACRQLVYGLDPADQALGAAGSVVGIADPQSLAAAALELLTDRDKWNAASTAGIRRVETYYTQEQMFGRYRAIYEAHAWPA